MPEISLDSSWRSRLDALAGGRRAATWIAALVAAAAVGAGLLLSRPPPARIAPPARAGGAPPAVLVHVAGAVRSPGLYELRVGARVADAIDAARGPRRRADLHALNLAAPLVDGQRIEVPRRTAPTAATPAPAAAASGTDAAASGTESSVNVNTADAAALEAVPGIGPVKAAAIVAHREEHGPFIRVEDLLEVDGIGPATLEQMRPYVTL